MSIEKLRIKNRKGQNIAVVVEEGKPNQDLVFVMHGLGGFKEQPHVQAFADPFRERGFTVVTFDTTNTLGESDGSYEDATTTNYYEDLEDVIQWAKQQSWFQSPFWLVGHSLGGICAALYVLKYPALVKAVAPISTVVSGELSFETYDKDELNDWQRIGWQIRPSNSKPGFVKKLKYSHMEDRLKYDLLPEADKLKLPVLLIVGEQDDSTPPAHQKMLYEKLNCDKELHVIAAGPHTFKNETHLNDIKRIFGGWIDKILASK